MPNAGIDVYLGKGTSETPHHTHLQGLLELNEVFGYRPLCGILANDRNLLLREASFCIIESHLKLSPCIAHPAPPTTQSAMPVTQWSAKIGSPSDSMKKAVGREVWNHSSYPAMVRSKSTTSLLG